MDLVSKQRKSAWRSLSRMLCTWHTSNADTLVDAAETRALGTNHLWQQLGKPRNKRKTKNRKWKWVLTIQQTQQLHKSNQQNYFAELFAFLVSFLPAPRTTWTESSTSIWSDRMQPPQQQSAIVCITCRVELWLQRGIVGVAVSYTHLTLPTICSV